MAESARDPMDRIGVACCAFGNTFTLPIVFLVEVLGAAFGDRVAGYVALYLIGWSPALWTAGYLLITGAAGADATRSRKETVAFIAKEVCNPPMIGICLGVLIGCTPLRHVLIGTGSTGSIDLTSGIGIPLELGVAFAAARVRVRARRARRRRRAPGADAHHGVVVREAEARRSERHDRR